jgi:SAM-dependent methyltransferase
VSRRYWLPVSVLAAVGLNTARLRRRLSALAVIAPSDEAVHYDHVFLVADGVRLDDAQQRAASAHATSHGLDVLDLVPEHLTADRLLDLARMLDTTTYQDSRLAPGRGAYQALLVRRDVLTRAGLEQKDVTEPDLVAVLGTLKRHAPVSTGTAVLPGLRSAPRSGADRFAVRRAAYAWEPTSLGAPLVRDGLLAAGATATPGWTLAAAVAIALQPLLVAANGPLRLTDAAISPLARRSGAAELLADLTGRDATAAGKATAGRAGSAAANDAVTVGERLDRWRVALPSQYGARDRAHAAEVRAAYTADLAGGVERFLEPRRTTCPWCGGARLDRAVVGGDAMQAKPGRFRYDRCADCRHVFQNPRLTPDGLDFYYRDFYDGLGGPAMEWLLGFGPGAHPARARAVPAAPRRWLDVGGGLGHFCLMARETWPDTIFDGLDMGDGIDEAARRGWVDTAHRGQFPQLAPGLAGGYDVVSMFHYLEHTRDPRAELDAAALVLSPGGRLLVEVPNPDSPAMRAYGALASGMLIPQHLNLLPADNLVAALTERGLEVESVEFGETHISGDGPMAWWGLCQRLAPAPGLPWRPDDRVALSRARRVATFTALAPLLPAAALAEAASRPYLTRGNRANAYRVLARLP